MKCAACGFNSFDYLEICKKCGAPLYPDPLFKYINRDKSGTADNGSEIRSASDSDEIKGRERLRNRVHPGDDKRSVDEPVEPADSQRNQSSNMEQGIEYASFEGTAVSKETMREEAIDRGAESSPAYTGQGIPLFEADDEITVPGESPFIFDEEDEVPDDPESAQEFESNETKPAVFSLAGLGARIAAFIVDILIVSVIAFLSIAAGLYSLNGLKIESLGLERVIIPLYLALFFLASTYFVFLHGYGGKTVGKMIFGIKLINGHGEGIGFWDAFVRWIGYFVSGGFLFIGFLWSLFDAECQTWHDKIAGTYVVKD